MPMRRKPCLERGFRRFGARSREADSGREPGSWPDRGLIGGQAAMPSRAPRTATSTRSEVHNEATSKTKALCKPTSTDDRTKRLRTRSFHSPARPASSRATLRAPHTRCHAIRSADRLCLGSTGGPVASPSLPYTCEPVDPYVHINFTREQPDERMARWLAKRRTAASYSQTELKICRRLTGTRFF